MNVLILGSGGREHALAWKMAQSPMVETVYGAPGNPGIDRLEKGTCVNIAADDMELLSDFIAAEDIALTVVGPEAPLVKGVVDVLSAPGRWVFGPTRAAARLEASKCYAKEFMRRYRIPTADYAVFECPKRAMEHVRSSGLPIVIKADGLAAGKGVTVARAPDQAEQAIRSIMEDRVFGEAGARVVIEECLEGEEASILAFCDGKIIRPLASSQDHKPAWDDDQGPNTGGMGAYSPAPVVTEALMEHIQSEILEPTLRGMEQEGAPYTGILYAGLMITAIGPKVIEYNVRFGDPETQAILPRMDTDILPILLACCRGELGDHEIEYRSWPCVSVVMASEGYPGPYEKGRPIFGIQHAEAIDGVQVFCAGVKDTGFGWVTAGGRVLNVTAVAPTLPESVDKAYEAAGRIQFAGAHYRRDIARKALRRLEVR